MKMHTTNTYNTFITVAKDCRLSEGEIPPTKEDKTIANIQFELISEHPYQYTSDDIIFRCFAIKKGLTREEEEEQRILFFSKEQPCLRTSPLTKRYGWGIHSNADGKVALYRLGTEEYKKLAEDENLEIVSAMSSKKK